MSLEDQERQRKINVMQIKLIDYDMRQSLLSLIRDKEEYSIEEKNSYIHVDSKGNVDNDYASLEDRTSEHEVSFSKKGFDIIIYDRITVFNRADKNPGPIHTYGIKLLPSLNDYLVSTIMQNMHRLKETTFLEKMVLIVDFYHEGIPTLKELRHMFDCNGHKLVFMHEIEVEWNKTFNWRNRSGVAT